MSAFNEDGSLNAAGHGLAVGGLLSVSPLMEDEAFVQAFSTFNNYEDFVRAFNALADEVYEVRAEHGHD